MSTINNIERPEIFEVLDILDGDVNLLMSVISEFMITEKYQKINVVIETSVRSTGEKYETEIKIEKRHVD